MVLRRIVWLALVINLILAIGSIFVGVIDLQPSAVLVDPAARDLIWISRFPRTMAVIIAGAVLAVAGMIMQAIAR